MYTHIHTVEWDYIPEISTDTMKYLMNRIDNRYLCEYILPKGNEYYICSEAQVRAKMTGNYIGCVKKTDRLYPNVLVFDHDKEVEKTISLNDEKYL